jgi:polysaccharide deacetylase 2 family uncharacterized protein YibQ
MFGPRIIIVGERLGTLPFQDSPKTYQAQELDPEKVKIILSELRRRRLFFLDSRTTSETTGLQIAESIGVRATERNLFLDHSQDPEEIKRQLEKLVQLSLETGKAIGIGHPHPSTLKSLREMIPRMKGKGILIYSWKR